MQAVLCSSSRQEQRLWRWRGWRIRYSFRCLPAVSHQPPIILIHGFGANLNQWRDNLLPLSQHYPVYGIDLLGFGGSEKAATLYSSDLWAEQVYDFWRSQINRPAILLGHSLGALVAITAATRHPDMALRLMMITLPPAREDLVAGWVADAARRAESISANPLLVRLLFYTLRQPGLLRRVLGSIYSSSERVDGDLIETFAQPPQERGAARTLGYLVRSRTQPNFSPSTRLMVESLQIPTLLLWGRQDRVVPYFQAESVAARSPMVDLHTLPGGHCCYDEEPELTNQAILEWLERTW
ncbi:alpha/beta hydrolase [filamentous cyanobacterium CCP5]|nr:alpha/beta hydrolase [filamentous cyanobacterium CCP5]